MPDPKPVSRLEKTLNTVSIVLSGAAIGISLAASGLPIALAAGLALGVAGPVLYLYKDVKVEDGSAGRAAKPSSPDAPEGGVLSRLKNMGRASLQQAFAAAAPRAYAMAPVKAAETKAYRRTKYGASFDL